MRGRGLNAVVAVGRWALVLILVISIRGSVGAEQDGPGQTSAPEPKPSADALHREATRAFERADIAASAAAFDRLVEHYPERIPHLWQRGITLYYAGRYQDCVEQFTRHREVNPHDAENSAWHFLCTAKLEGVDEAAARLFPAKDPRVPLMAIHTLYSSKGSADDVLRAVSEGDPSPRALRVRDFYANLYIALWYEAQGQSGEALRYLHWALAGEPVGHYMETVAKVHRILAARAKEEARQTRERFELSKLSPRVLIGHARSNYGTPLLLICGQLISCVMLLPLVRRSWAERWLSVAVPVGEVWSLLVWGIWSSANKIQAIDHMSDPGPTVMDYWAMAFSQVLALGVFAGVSLLFSMIRRTLFPKCQPLPLASQVLLLAAIWIDWMLFLLSVTPLTWIREGYTW